MQGRPKHNHNHNSQKKKTASDATPKQHLMAHQMKDFCGFSVLHYVQGASGASSGGTPKLKNGTPQDELKNGCGRGWAVPYVGAGEILCVSFVNCAFRCFFLVWPCNCLALGDVQTILVIFFSLTEAPLPDPTPTPPNTPKRTRNGPETDPKQTRSRPETDPNGPKGTETDPKRTEIKLLGVGRPGGASG